MATAGRNVAIFHFPFSICHLSFVICYFLRILTVLSDINEQEGAPNIQ
jgi:hypothetical protein